jgi:hypothetical protein
MLPFSKDSAYDLQVNLPQGSFSWCDNYELGVQAKELLRLEAKFFHQSLEPDEGAKSNEVYAYIERKTRKIMESSSLLVDPQVKNNLAALEGDAEFLNLLRGGFSEPIRAGKIWGDSKYKEMVTFTKQRFGPAYALLIICIFGTTGRYRRSRLTIYQLARIIQRISQDIRHDRRSLYCPVLEKYWSNLIRETMNDFTCAPLLSGGIMDFQTGGRISGDPEGTSTHRSGQDWHATVMNGGELDSHRHFNAVMLIQFQMHTSQSMWVPSHGVLEGGSY